MSPLPLTPPADLVQQKQITADVIWAIGAFCVFGWEWLLCLPQEYNRIWTKPMNYSSYLYIANRYFGLLQLSFVMTLLANVWSHEACIHMYLWEPVGTLISTVLSQMILGSRVYAVFSRNKMVAFVLGSTLIVEVAIGGIAISTTSPPSAGPVGTGPPCRAIMGPFGLLVTFWSIPLFYDTNTFLLTVWKAYGYWKVEVNTPLFDIIWRDGLLYFFVIFTMNVANIIIFLTVPQSLRAVNLTPTLVLEVVLSCRLVLNLRSAAASGEASTTSAMPGFLPWSNSSKIRIYANNPSSSFIAGDHQSFTTDFRGSTSTLGRVLKLEPNRALPEYTWNALTLYTNKNETLWYSK